MTTKPSELEHPMIKALNGLSRFVTFVESEHPQVRTSWVMEAQDNIEKAQLIWRTEPQVTEAPASDARLLLDIYHEIDDLTTAQDGSEPLKALMLGARANLATMMPRIEAALAKAEGK